MVTSDTGGVIDLLIIPDNVDDRRPPKNKNFTEQLWGKLYRDKGYISKELFQNLFTNSIHLVTKLRKNMKSRALTPIIDAILLRKWAIAETIIDQLKNIFQIEHSHHRIPKNFLTKIFSALIAYNFTEKNHN